MGNGGNDSSPGGAFALHCRGDVRLYRDGIDCTPKSKKGRALLAVLAAEQRPLTRVRIIDLLWSDRQEEQARGSLRTLLADLKEQFDNSFDQLLIVDRERITLGPAVRTDLTDPTLVRPAGELFEGLDHIDPELDEWLRVERQKWSAMRPAVEASPSEGPSRPPQWRFSGAAAGVLLVALIAAALAYFRPWDRAPEPVLAVLKFRDVTRENGYLADGLAEQLRLALGEHAELSVIAPSSSEAEQVTRATVRRKGELLGATHLVEGTILPHQGELGLALRLIDARQGRTIWTGVLPATGPAMLTEDRAPAVEIARMLGSISLRKPDDRGLRADPQAFVDTFRARALITTEDPAKAAQARAILLEVVSRYPEFAPALSMLSTVSFQLSDHPTMGIGTTPLSAARRDAILFARRAVKAAPQSAVAHEALAGAYYEMPQELALRRRAAELSPKSGKMLGNYARALQARGQNREAAKQCLAAVKLDPISHFTRFACIDMLVALGRTKEARAQLNDFLRRDVAPALRYKLIAATEMATFGDWSNTYVAANMAVRLDPRDPAGRDYLMWAVLLMYGPEAAVPLAPPNSVTQLILRDDLPGLLSKVRMLGPEFWRLSYETGAATHYLYSRGQSRLLVKLFDDAVKAGINREAIRRIEIIHALRDVGRSHEAAALTREAAAEGSDLKGVVSARSELMPAWVRAMQGRNDEAIRHLQRAHGANWWALSALLDHPYNHYAFRGLRRDGRFRALVRDYDRWVAEERKQTAAQAKAAGLPPPPSSPPPPADLS